MWMAAGKMSCGGRDSFKGRFLLFRSDRDGDSIRLLWENSQVAIFKHFRINLTKDDVSRAQGFDRGYPAKTLSVTSLRVRSVSGTANNAKQPNGRVIQS